MSETEEWNKISSKECKAPGKNVKKARCEVQPNFSAKKASILRLIRTSLLRKRQILRKKRESCAPKRW